MSEKAPEITEEARLASLTTDVGVVEIEDTEPVKQAVTGLKRFFYKDGEFSKTAVFATIANLLVCFAYAVSIFAGTSFVLGPLGTLVLPAFDPTAAMAVLGIINGSYLANNGLKNSRMKIHKKLP